MKPKSLVFFFSGILIGALGGILLTPQKTLKKKKGPVKKLNKTNKSLKATADKYKRELREMEESSSPKPLKATRSAKKD